MGSICLVNIFIYWSTYSTYSNDRQFGVFFFSLERTADFSDFFFKNKNKDRFTPRACACTHAQITRTVRYPFGGGPCRGSYTSFPISNLFARDNPNASTTIAGTDASGPAVLTSNVRMLLAVLPCGDACTSILSNLATPNACGGKNFAERLAIV